MYKYFGDSICEPGRLVPDAGSKFCRLHCRIRIRAALTEKYFDMEEKMTDQENKYDCLHLDSQLCFPLYACSKEIIRRYKPFLDSLDLTYTQYITMMAMWEHGKMNVKELGKCLFLDSGTLTPVLKKLEAKGYLHRDRSRTDERNLIVTITEEGTRLRDRALSVPGQMACCIDLSEEEAKMLYTVLYKILDHVSRD